MTKILDRYVAKNFLWGYFIAFMVLMGMRIVIDLFVNLDEFAEHADLGTADVLFNIFRFYGYQSAMYFRDFAGMITVVAAVFSLAKMTRNNELIAVMASGVSLKRVITPIIILAVLLSGIAVLDQELVIPRIADKLVRTHDELPGQESYPIWFMEDEKNSLFCTSHYREKTETMEPVTIIVRGQETPTRWQTMGKIQADKAVYDPQRKGWELINGEYFEINRNTEKDAIVQKPLPVAFYKSDVTPEDIPQRRKQTYKSLLSFNQLSMLEKQRKRIKDLAELYSQKHFHITDPLINIIMLLIALPVLVCRDPKAMKTSIGLSFVLTTLCFIVTFVCKMMATEVVFNQVRPELWAWAPVFIFAPIVVIELDSMKT